MKTDKILYFVFNLVPFPACIFPRYLFQLINYFRAIIYTQLPTDCSKMPDSLQLPVKLCPSRSPPKELAGKSWAQVMVA